MRPLSRRRFLGAGLTLLVSGCSSTSGSATTTTAGGTTAGATTTAGTTTTSGTTTASSAPATTTTLAPVDFDDPFRLGVASGDPDATGVVLWTRLAPDPAAADGGMPGSDVTVRWEVAADASFTTILDHGDAVAGAADAHSVHVTVTLDDDAERWYRFRVGQHTSPAGRTRRAPSGPLATVTFASAACQNFQGGFYAAHRDLAAQEPAFVVWLGDYIYEAAGDGTGRSNPPTPAADLATYRQRYAWYKSDPDLQAAHQAAPWFVVWDDHEVQNDYAGSTPSGGDAATFAARRGAAYRAWWEHMPVRLPAPGDDPAAEYRIYRDARWGDLVGLALLDGRQYRSDQACTGPTAAAACPGIGGDERTMLGAEQERWLAGTFGSWHTTWNVLGNQTVLTPLRLAGVVLNPDQWDGYPAAPGNASSPRSPRRATSSSSPGDIHASIVGQLRQDDVPVGVELVATSISSSSQLDASSEPLVKLLPDVVDAELGHRGYLLHTVSVDEWRTELRLVDDVATADSPVSGGGRFRIAAGTSTVQRA